jgi:hypothetical protein
MVFRVDHTRLRNRSKKTPPAAAGFKLASLGGRAGAGRNGDKGARSCWLNYWTLGESGYLSAEEALYQATHELTVLVYSRAAIDRIRAGAAMSLFQAIQQASTIAS